MGDVVISKELAQKACDTIEHCRDIYSWKGLEGPAREADEVLGELDRLIKEAQ